MAEPTKSGRAKPAESAESAQAMHNTLVRGDVVGFGISSEEELEAHGVSQSLPALGKTRRSDTAELARRWAGDLALAAAVGAAYFLVAQVTMLGAAFPDKSALFWPAAGISSGILIALGPRRRWPAATGIVAAEAVAAHVSWHNPWITAALAICDPVEALTVAGLVARYFGGADFALNRARNVFGLLAAAVVGAAAPRSLRLLRRRCCLGRRSRYCPLGSAGSQGTS